MSKINAEDVAEKAWQIIGAVGDGLLEYEEIETAINYFSHIAEHGKAMEGADISNLLMWEMPGNE